MSWIPQSSSVRYQHLGSAWAAIRSNTPPEVRTWHYLLYRACRKKGSVCSGPSRRPGLVSCLLFSALHMWLALRPRVSLCPFPPWLLIRQSILGGTCLSPCAWWGRCGYSMYCTKPICIVQNPTGWYPENPRPMFVWRAPICQYPRGSPWFEADVGVMIPATLDPPG